MKDFEKNLLALGPYPPAPQPPPPPQTLDEALNRLAYGDRGIIDRPAHLAFIREQIVATVAAWARLVRAERAHHDQTDLLGQRDEDMKGAFAEVCAALQALRDLGVHVDALLGAP